MPLDFYTGAGTQPHRFRVTGDNGEIVAIGEGYTERRNAEHGAAVALDQLLRHHPDAEQVAHRALTSGLSDGSTMTTVMTDDDGRTVVITNELDAWASRHVGQLLIEVAGDPTVR